MPAQPLSKDVLKLDCENAVDLICNQIRTALSGFRRRGLIVALSGGIDSSVTAALAVRAIGHARVFGVHMPERDSSANTLELSQLIATHFGFDSVVEEITPILDSVGCYTRQKESIRLVIPEYGEGWKSKITIESVVQNKGFNFYHVVAQSPTGELVKKRLSSEAFLGVVAATNFKQRVRKMMEYYHADRLNFAVTGTPNRLEYDQGFFVKLGDGSADLKPIVHLYKSQVYELADYLGIPDQVRMRPPTTDTYSLPQSQEEFYFSLPYDSMDLALFGFDHGYSAEEVGAVLSLSAEQMERVFRDIESKRKMAEYLHAAPFLVQASVD